MSDSRAPGSKTTDEVTQEAAPYVDVVAEMVATGGNRHQLSPMPALDSPAISALSQQEEYPGIWLAQPVDALNAMIDGALTLAEEQMAAFVTLMRSEDPPTFAHLSNVRSALEGIGVVHHLAEPGENVPERIRRVLNLNIGELEVRLRLPKEMIDRSAIRARAAEYAEAHGTLGQVLGKKNSNRIQYIGSKPPGQQALVVDLMADDGLGKVVYLELSGAAHSGFLNGLLSNVVPLTEPEGGVSFMGIQRTSFNIARQACVLIMGHQRAFREYSWWFGRELSPERMTVEREAEKALWAINDKIRALEDEGFGFLVPTAYGGHYRSPC